MTSRTPCSARQRACGNRLTRGTGALSTHGPRSGVEASAFAGSGARLQAVQCGGLCCLLMDSPNVTSLSSKLLGASGEESGPGGACHAPWLRRARRRPRSRSGCPGNWVLHLGFCKPRRRGTTYMWYTKGERNGVVEKDWLPPPPGRIEPGSESPDFTS